MNSGPVLKHGSHGADVKRLQRLFVMMKSLGPSDIVGTFGPKTETAVRDFQSGNSIPVDGVVGSVTWGKLPPDPGTAILKKGSHGNAVTALQKGLAKYGAPGSATDPGGSDGVFGPKTEKAVKAYQHERGVTADGIVGDATWWAPAGAAGATLASLSGLTTT